MEQSRQNRSVLNATAIIHPVWAGADIGAGESGNFKLYRIHTIVSSRVEHNISISEAKLSESWSRDVRCDEIIITGRKVALPETSPPNRTGDGPLFPVYCRFAAFIGNNAFAAFVGGAFLAAPAPSGQDLELRS